MQTILTENESAAASAPATQGSMTDEEVILRVLDCYVRERASQHLTLNGVRAGENHPGRRRARCGTSRHVQSGCDCR